jgi:thiamine biosynthesis lipoprotein
MGRVRRTAPLAGSVMALKVIFIALGILAASACGRSADARAPLAAAREYVMGTVVEMRVHAAPSVAVAAGALEAALAELRVVDRLMAVQRAESDVSRVNREGTRHPVLVDARVIEVLEASRRVSRLTGGAFDVTVLPVVQAWGFTDGRPARPGVGVHPAVSGWRHVKVDRERGTVRLTADAAAIDLGGIAKGYALDRARALLRARGVRSAYLDLGGEIATLGAAPDGGRWRIGIRHPRRPDALIGVLELDEGVVSTSGDGEQYLAEGERRAGHIVDPRSGRPADGPASATVVTASATSADALSTAAVVLGAARSRPLLQRLGAGMIVAELGPDGEVAVTTTPGLAFEPAPGIAFRKGKDT